jgi:hypothetical protein
LDPSTPVGTWYLVANAHWLELAIHFQNNSYSGSTKNEGEAPEPITMIPA